MSLARLLAAPSIAIAAAAVTAVVAASCATQPAQVSDAGCLLDAQSSDTGIVTEAGACGPLVTGFTPDTMVPPQLAHAGRCSPQQIIDYAACQTDTLTLCSEFLPGRAGADCGACIETRTSTAPAAWGVLVFSGVQQARFNYGGCVDLALGQVALEPASCGQLLYASYGCQEAACAACEGQTTSCGDAFAACSALVNTGECQSYDALVASPTGPCAAMFDGGPADVTNCFPDPAIDNSVARRKDFLTRIVTYFCGT